MARDPATLRSLLSEKILPRFEDLARKRRDVEREIAEYAQLQARLRAVEAEKAERAGAGGDGVKTLVNVGSDMFMQATAPLNVVHVAIGYGLMPELSLDEAAAFIPKRVALLKRRADFLSQRIAETNVHAQAARATLAELGADPAALTSA